MRELLEEGFEPFPSMLSILVEQASLLLPEEERGVYRSLAAALTNTVDAMSSAAQPGDGMSAAADL